MAGTAPLQHAIASLVLLACTVLTLLVIRRRGAVVRVAMESVLLLAIGAFLLSQGSSPLQHGDGLLAEQSAAWFRALAIVWWLVAARLAVTITVLAHGLDVRSRGARLFSDLAAAVIYLTAILFILNFVFDLNVRSLLLTSGVIAIVLGLALQNTLADVFFGIAIGLERPFRLGDRVSFGENTEGAVVQMNWRSIRIHSDGNDLVTIPNSLVAKGQIVNRSMPTRHRSASVEIAVRSEVDTEMVFELMRHATLLCPNLLNSPPPSVAIHRSGLHASTYAASFFVADSAQIDGAKSTLLRQIRRVFRHAGIGAAAPPTSLALLGSLTLFEGLVPDDLAKLAASLVPHIVEPEDTIFEQGAVASSMYVVVSGVLEVRRHGVENGDPPLGRIGAGEYIGELGLITGAPRAFNLTALTHATVLELPGENIATLMSVNAAVKSAMERAVRKGLVALERDDAVRAIHPTYQSMDALARIWAFFGFQHAGASPLNPEPP